MSRCKDCKYFTEPTSKWGKGSCDYYNSSAYPDDSACNHFTESSSGGCFLTTACCQYNGLPDNCYELTTLRTFRDQFVAKQSYGKKLIDTYYADAPKIIEYIDRQENRSEIFDSIFGQIQNIVHVIEEGKNDTAVILYMNMVHELYRNAFVQSKYKANNMTI